MRAGPSHVYHVGCFACVACMQPLQKGQQYVVKAGGGQLFCRTDFEKEIFLMQQTVGSPQPGKLRLIYYTIKGSLWGSHKDRTISENRDIPSAKSISFICTVLY